MSMMDQFMPMIEAKYNSLDHEQMHRDFMEDDTGLFEKYFEFCDIGQDGVLTAEDDIACREKTMNLIKARIPIPVEAMAMGLPTQEANAVTEMIFEKFIDMNHDGQTTLEELQMGTYCLLRTAAQLGLQFMGNENAELDSSIFPDFEAMSEVKSYDENKENFNPCLGSTRCYQLRGGSNLLPRPPEIAQQASANALCQTTSKDVP